MIGPTGIVWIASYPKSGSTWVRMLLASLSTGAQAPNLRNLGRHCPGGVDLRWLEKTLDVETRHMTADQLSHARREAMRNVSGKDPRWFKVHDRFTPDLFPEDVTAACVYIVRDARDVAPSWADHMNVDLDTAITRMGDPNFTLSRVGTKYHEQAPQTLGSWSDHVQSWLAAPLRPLLLLRYEDLLADPLHQATRLAKFLGLPVQRDVIAASVDACAFDKLQAREIEEGFSERMSHQHLFFRQGRAGAWREVLSAAQARRIWNAHQSTMLALGYDEGGFSGGL